MEQSGVVVGGESPEMCSGCVPRSRWTSSSGLRARTYKNRHLENSYDCRNKNAERNLTVLYNVRK